MILIGKIVLLKIWRVLPDWTQEVLSRLIRPLFQVFAAAVIFSADSKILLVRSTYKRSYPWGLPGGSLDYGESPEAAVAREVLEETGLSVEIKKFMFIKTWLPDRVGIYYLCEVQDGIFRPDVEVSEMGYFSLDDLPGVSPLDRELIMNLKNPETVYELA